MFISDRAQFKLDDSPERSFFARSANERSKEIEIRLSENPVVVTCSLKYASTINSISRRFSYIAASEISPDCFGINITH